MGGAGHPNPANGHRSGARLGGCAGGATQLSPSVGETQSRKTPALRSREVFLNPEAMGRQGVMSAHAFGRILEKRRTFVSRMQ